MAGVDVRHRLTARRQMLQQRSAELRERLVIHGAALAPVVDWADRVRQGWRWMRAHPWVPLVGAVVVTLRRPRLVWRGARWAWRGWRLWQRYGLWLESAGLRPGRRFTGTDRRAGSS